MNSAQKAVKVYFRYQGTEGNLKQDSKYSDWDSKHVPLEYICQARQCCANLLRMYPGNYGNLFPNYK
jgi:hypothetical protein